MRDVEIRSEPVELYKLLKFEGMASSGGEAKSVIAEGLVTVNGETETRKRKKILAGDIVGFAGEEIRVQTTPHSQENRSL
ncbi:MAG: RNA-binding S4 domain-containing protein [Xanthomonadales bacterium]|nr:RNA-binding S4 domain-containing protein [Xanthomonadales bacterium]MDH3923879.1 RNA-binding S4 domain-containing protein [Xanthomonadales bacterium]MDH3940339.1 RNA-binding S4 domain-containing protein [Xanthomonadales bacterium]MDH4001576.1 RNA-binding S4 domain-containing protein [Xanthomonadales bacterium]